jgi:hypothetical protein
MSIKILVLHRKISVLAKINFKKFQFYHKLIPKIPKKLGELGQVSKLAGPRLRPWMAGTRMNFFFFLNQQIY